MVDHSRMQTVTEGHSARRFGSLLRLYREELGLSQRTLAFFLSVSTSTIARVESGSRNPPLKVDFYQGLKDVPGLTELHIQALLETSDAPQLMVPTPRTSPLPPRPLPRAAVVSMAGLRMKFELDGEIATFSSKELDSVISAMEQTAKLLLGRLVPIEVEKER